MEHVHHRTGSGCQRQVPDGWPRHQPLSFLFWHAAQKEIRNADGCTHICGSHVFFFWQAHTCSRGRSLRERERERRRRDWEQRRGERETERKGEGEPRKKEKRIRGWREQREDLGAEEGKERKGEKEYDWGQRRGNERRGAFPHQMRSDGSNWGLCASGGRFRMRWWNFLNASFEKQRVQSLCLLCRTKQIKRCVYTLSMIIIK